MDDKTLLARLREAFTFVVPHDVTTARVRLTNPYSPVRLDDLTLIEVI